MKLKNYAILLTIFAVHGQMIDASELFRRAKTAVINNQMSTFNTLVANMNLADINQLDADGWSLLHFAVQSNNAYAVQDLINAGANVNQPDELGNNPLMLSIMLGCDRVIFNLLLDAQADPRLRNNQGQSVLDLMRQFLSNPDINPNDIDMALSIQKILQNRADQLNDQDLQEQRLRQRAHGRRLAEQVRIDRQQQAADRVAYLNYQW